MVLREPIQRRSQYIDYYVRENKVDYNINSPLNTFGYTYPCKGFKKDKYQMRYKIEGTESHEGDHFQFGISYDDKKFIVLKQVIRYCLIDTLNYRMNITEIPNGDIRVLWTWINAIGNREYYMDCADMNITKKIIAIIK